MSVNLSPRRMTPPPIYDAQGTTTLKPYLSLPHLLSLTWLAYPILSLLFVAFRLAMSSVTANDAVGDAKADLLASCAAAEKAATSAASLPRYLASATNRQISHAINGTMDGAQEALILALTVLEAILNFVIDTYRSTFLCFLELIIRGALGLLISAVQEISSFIQSTMSSIRTGIQNDVSTANSAIQSAIGAINKVNPFGNINVPQFSIPSLTSLENVTIPTDFENALISLNNSIPSPSQLKSAIDDIADTPFEALKSDINSTFGGLQFNVELLPVPNQTTITFCDQLDTSVIDDIAKDLVKTARIGIIILIFLALLLLAANCLLVWYKWRCMHRHLENTRRAWTSDPTIIQTTTVGSVPTLTMSDHNLLVLANDSEHPLLTRLANRLSMLLRFSPAQHIHLRWFLHYIFHPPALACFLIGFFGLLSVELQLLALGPVQRKFDKQVASSVQGFTETIATSMNATMFNQSSAYANDINGRVLLVQNSINDGVFGWVNGTTTTLNNTLNDFYQDIQNVVSTLFNNTPLENPVQDFVKCIIGSKIDAIEDALTFLHNNLNVDLPTVNETVLVLSQDDINEAAQPISQAAIGGGNGDDSGGVVGKLIARYEQSLKLERGMFGIFLGLWGVVVLMGICVILWHSYGVPLRERRRKRRWQREQRDGIEGFATPYRLDQFPDETRDEKPKEPRSFTPSMTTKPPGLFNGGLLAPHSPFPPSTPSSTVNNRQQGHEVHNLSLNPEFEKSWDSILDSTQSHENAVAPGVRPKSVSLKKGPRKLMAIGKRATGREVLISDERKAQTEADAANGVSQDNEDVSWMRKVMNVFGGKKEQDEEDKFTIISHPQRLKPKLTIATPSNSSIEEVDHRPPVSAWSVSPQQTRTLPWLSKPVPTSPKRPHGAFNVPIKPSIRRYNSPPAPAYEISNPIVPHTPVAIPFHQAFDRDEQQYPVPPQPPTPQAYTQPPTPHDHTPPSQTPIYDIFRNPSQEHRRSMSVPLPQYSMPPVHNVTPMTPSVTSTHAKHKSQAADPFRTPFDDDAMASMPTTPYTPASATTPYTAGPVPPVPPMSAGANTNPFATPFDDDASESQLPYNSRPRQSTRMSGNPFTVVAL